LGTYLKDNLFNQPQLTLQYMKDYTYKTLKDLQDLHKNDFALQDLVSDIKKEDSIEKAQDNDLVRVRCILQKVFYGEAPSHYNQEFQKLVSLEEQAEKLQEL